MTDATKLQSEMHDGAGQQQQASLPARLLGDASTQADQQAAGTTSAHGPPQIAQGDDERPMDKDTQDLGWAVYEQDVAQPLLSGMQNSTLWLLERRFNKQAFKVKRVDKSHLIGGGLDCNTADEHEFSPDRLRANLERFYTTVILALAGFFQHLARLRSWNEVRRSAFFAVLYALAWAFNKSLVFLVLLSILLITSPRSRRILFPPAPLAAISPTTGKAKVPEAEHLGSTQSLTGAKETYHGQAAEREAANFVSSLSTLAVSTAIGSEGTNGGDHSDAEDDDEEEGDDVDEPGTPSKKKNKKEKKATAGAGGALEDAALPDPTSIAKKPGTGGGKGGLDPSHSGGTDATAAPVDKAVWDKAGPVLRILEDVCDTFERFGNAMSPTPPFGQHVARLRLAGVLAPFALGASVLTPDIVYRSTTFLLGFLFFGQPVLDLLKPEPILAWLDEHVPYWRKYLELRHTILRGVPTNAQLTVTLLRIGEANKSPLPPPPLPIAEAQKKGKQPKPQAHEGQQMADHPDLPPEYRDEMREQAAEKQNEDQLKKANDDAEDDDEKKGDGEKKKEKKSSKILGFFKFGAKSATNSALGVNRAEATLLGSEHAKARLGVVEKDLTEQAVGDGPVAFKARYRGQKGLLIISTSSTTPCVSFEPRQPAVARAAMAAVEQIKAKEEEAAQSAGGEAEDEGGSSTAKRAWVETAERTRVPPLFSLQIEDIAEITKRGGLGWKAKLLVSWAMESDIADGLEIVTKTGEKYTITAIPRRDEVFNRLIALSPNTNWELA
ncbi:unnamed protein product [Tilletia laevis]|uniref:Uncharacterized protein n=2 Tax=Tilletia TaxID=13289 RepID=A0A177VD81_9BASI|nr:hypothetical protein CF336_g1233 [Tilletia laevis]KAE8262808.1 hypothetical protein A4X03_0g2160 [Tilletia caries]KAE8208056.1 hypothetical protein CF335_g689 [Tilletia laevis]CAD6893209.1 unnamed protein product [Tilletia caries]CAD6898223.1 unnamed protein product [Tilletia laevis]